MRETSEVQPGARVRRMMVPEEAARGYLSKLVADLVLAIRSGRMKLALRLADETKQVLAGAVYGDHLTRSQVRGMLLVASLLRSGQTAAALSFLDGELRRSFYDPRELGSGRRPA